MADSFRKRLEALYDFVRAQLTESSTVRGVLVLATLGGGTLAKIPPDTTLTLAIVLGAALKVLLPDNLFHDGDKQ